MTRWGEKMMDDWQPPLRKEPTVIQSNHFIWLTSTSQSNREQCHYSQCEGADGPLSSRCRTWAANGLEPFLLSADQNIKQLKDDWTEIKKQKHFLFQLRNMPGLRSEPWGTPETMPKLVAISTPGLFDLWTLSSDQRVYVSCYWQLNGSMLGSVVDLTGSLLISSRVRLHRSRISPAGISSWQVMPRSVATATTMRRGRAVVLKRRRIMFECRWSSPLLLLYVLPHPPSLHFVFFSFITEFSLESHSWCHRYFLVLLFPPKCSFFISSSHFSSLLFFFSSRLIVTDRNFRAKTNQ